ncbi:effector-associated constant component EACC1 [Dactylosporangium sp. CS-047395]|uniref:effector-associated constant component EACC1 n=1 Tax=Dactylosporangium sp. CS-047395 TaxID=3239936 RepID=UPI003D92B20E
MNIDLSLTGDVPDVAVPNLTHHLRRDSTVGRTVTFRPVPRPPTGTMGATEIIGLVLTHAEAISGVLIAYAAWRKAQRKRPTTVRLAVKGQTIELKDITPEDIAAVVAKLQELDDAG